ncbi:MAG: flagellar hook-length control protein FliK [Proteobacteria bacterium]|nr:flagellar hook-length control protein FliK [Pseudomonadota bacterium]
MTAAVGSAAQSGAETLLQTGSVASGGGRNHIKHSDKIPCQAEEASQQATMTALNSSDMPVEQTEKTSKRKHSNTNSSDDDTSFEDTFDSIGQEASKDDKGKKIDLSQIGLVGLPIVQQAVNNVQTENSNTDQKTPDKSPATGRAVTLLRQDSILALMDAKDRIFSNARDGMAVDKPAEQVFAKGNTADEVATPITVDRQETHWNFDNKVVTNAALQVSALQSHGPNLVQAATITVSKEKPSESTVALTVTAQKAPPQTVATPEIEPPSNLSFSDTSGQSTSNSGNGGQTGAQLQSSASANTTERKIEKADPSPSIDQIFTASGKPAQAPTTAVDQVRNGIVDNLSDGTTDQLVSKSSTVSSSRPVAAPVLRTLDLTLSPEDLGSVKLRLSLKSNSLAIEAEASKASTAKLLNDDRVSLERGLRDAGYDVSSMKVTDASASNSANSSNWQAGGSPPRDGDQARSGFAGRQDSNAQNRDGAMFNQPQRRQKEDNPQTTTADLTNGRLGNALYI